MMSMKEIKEYWITRKNNLMQ